MVYIFIHVQILKMVIAWSAEWIKVNVKGFIGHLKYQNEMTVRIIIE